MTAGQVPRRVGIVGAGVAGAACARALADAGCAVQVFDKSRGVGGRMATRRASWVPSPVKNRVTSASMQASSVAMRPVPPASGAASAAGMTSSGHIHHVPSATMGTTVTSTTTTSSERRRCRYRAASAASVAW